MIRFHYQISSDITDPSGTTRAPLHTLTAARAALAEQGGRAAGRRIWRAAASSDGSATMGGWERVS